MSRPDLLATADIRKRFLAFFEAKGHRVVPSASLVPGNDKTLLFTNAGMVPFKDVFTGEEQRDYVRATSAQRCVRAGGKHNDLENVGYTARHHTFFEMLGNFSFGDYFKAEAIEFAWTFLTVELGLPADRLWVTVFEEDEQAEAIWTDRIGVPAERVIRIGAKDNFWMMGDTGPCGPCSEIFYDHGPDVAGGPPGSPDEDGDRYIEIWNLVFMQFERTPDGQMLDLPKPCVDTGMGLERVAAVLQHVHSNYEIDLFQALIGATAQRLGVQDLSEPSLRVIADHIRSCAFLIVDGVLPGNEGRGYVLRRIIRRAARHGHKLGATEPFFHQLTDALVKEMGAAYPELVAASQQVREQLLLEEQRFAATLSAGLGILDDAVAKLDGSCIPGEVMFRLYDTYGFPADLTADIAREKQLTVDQEGFEILMEAQRTRARAASQFKTLTQSVQSDSNTRFVGYDHLHTEAHVLELFVDGVSVDQLAAGDAALVVLDVTPFYAESGGQIGDTGVLVKEGMRFDVQDTQKRRQAIFQAGVLQSGTLKVGDALTASVDEARRVRIQQHHSATHLLHGGLRAVLGSHVEQKGSLVAEDQLRFDFSHGAPLTADERMAVERWIDAEVRANSPCVIEEMAMDEAVAAGAMALFGEKYGDRVRVVTLGDRSVELCGGTHVAATGELGAVLVVNESGVAAGVRRVEALSGAAALAHVQANEQQLSGLGDTLKSPRQELLPRLVQLQGRNRKLQRRIEQLEAKLSSSAGRDLAADAESIGAAAVLLKVIEAHDAKQLRALMDQLRQQLGNSAIVLASEANGKVAIIATVAKPLHQSVTAGDLLSQVTGVLGGRGGGRADMAQGGAESLDNIDAAFAQARDWLGKQLAD